MGRSQRTKFPQQNSVFVPIRPTAPPDIVRRMSELTLTTSRQVRITRNLRDRLVERDADPLLAKALADAPVRKRHLLLDLADHAVRQALSLAIRPFLTRQPETPPALVGFARRVGNAIDEYERKISNYDLFEEH